MLALLDPEAEQRITYADVMARYRSWPAGKDEVESVEVSFERVRTVTGHSVERIAFSR